MRVMGRLTRPLPLPGPWGLPGPYQIYTGARLNTTDLPLQYKPLGLIFFSENVACNWKRGLHHEGILVQVLNGTTWEKWRKYFDWNAYCIRQKFLKLSNPKMKNAYLKTISQGQSLKILIMQMLELSTLCCRKKQPVGSFGRFSQKNFTQNTCLF